MRKYQQSLMLIVTVVVIISFVVLYNVQRGPERFVDRAGSVYGKSVSSTQYARESRKFGICQPLGLMELWGTLIGREARDENQAVESFVWNGMVLRHEASALEIEPTDDEVTDTIKNLPAFQTNAAYDPNKYNELVGRIASRGFTGQQIEELVQDSLRLEKLKKLVGSTLSATPAEVRRAFEMRNQKNEVSLVRLKLEEFVKTANVTDEDVAKLYEERKETLKSDELRKVKYVGFVLEKTEKPLAGKERVAAMSKLGDRAQEFAVAMTEKDANFDEVAKKFGMEVKETSEFALDAPPEALGHSSETAQMIFEKLSKEQPNSDVALSENGYYVVQLTGMTPARPLSLEETKVNLTEQLKQERAQEALNLKAAEIRTKIQAAIKSGKSFAEAAAAVGVKTETLPPFSMVEPPKSDAADDTRLIMGSAFELAEGQLSSPITTPAGALLLHVDKRLPVDEKKFELEKTPLSENIARGKRESAFELWLKERRALANVVTARS